MGTEARARRRQPGVKLICFDPNPGDTRGEAEFVGRLAKEYRWDSVVLVTTRAQDTRARIVVGRCFSGSIYVMTGSLPLGNWPYQVAYQWGALFKALVRVPEPADCGSGSEQFRRGSPSTQVGAASHGRGIAAGRVTSMDCSWSTGVTVEERPAQGLLLARTCSW